MKAELTEPEFERLRARLFEWAGLVFDGTRKDSLAYSMGELLPGTGFANVTAYLDFVETMAGLEERQRLLDEVTIPETYFFRNPPQIRALRKYVLPELIARAREDGSRRILIWSAGCSTGDEPYTLAMMLIEAIPDIDMWDVRIVATDVSQRALTAAKRGRYGQRSVNLADAATVGRFFDLEHGDYVVRPEVRALVQFRHHNLIKEPAPFLSQEVDLILCRNVTIYFDRDTTRGLMSRFHRSLKNGGYLFLGHAETLWQVTDAFKLVTLGDAFVYRRLDEAKPARGERRLAVVGEAKADRADRADPKPKDRKPGKLSGIAALSRLAVHGHRGEDGERARVPAVVPSPALTEVEPTIAAVSELLAGGRYAEAAELADKVALRHPLLAEARYLRGMALCNLGRDREALADLRKAVYLDPLAGFAHFLLAGALARIGEPVAAAAAYRAAAESLGRRPADAFAAELGGRSLEELVELCRSLAGATESRASGGGGA